MPERKKIALMNKLTTLFKEEIIDEKELKMFRFMLTQDRSRGTLNSAHNAILNELEYNECTLECYVRSKEMPPVYGLSFDTKCRYKYDPDAGRQDVGHGKGRYFVYAPVTVPQDAQLTHKQALDKIEGREIDYSKVPDERVFYKRIAFAKVEFEKWFGYDDEELIGNADTTETYEF